MVLSVDAHVEGVVPRRWKDEPIQIQNVRNQNPAGHLPWPGRKAHLSINADNLTTVRRLEHDAAPVGSH